MTDKKTEGNESIDKVDSSTSSFRGHVLPMHRESIRSYEKGFSESQRKESLNRREAELSKVTGEAVKQMEKLITVTQAMHELEDLNNQIQEENNQLQIHGASLEAELTDKNEEINDLKLYIRELHKELLTSRENVAQFRSETDRLKIEQLVRRGGVILGMSTTPDELDEDSDNSTEQGTRLKRLNNKAQTSQSNNRNYHSFGKSFERNSTQQTSSSNDPQLTIQIHTQENDVKIDYELRQLKRQINGLMRQMRENESITDSLKRENEALRQKLTGRARIVDVDTVDSRSKDELLRVIRFSIEEKVRWQAYAERLIRRILRLSPQVLDVTRFTVSHEYGYGEFTESIEPRWEAFALSLVQKVMEVDPHMLDTFSQPNKTDHEKLGAVGFV